MDACRKKRTVHAVWPGKKVTNISSGFLLMHMVVYLGLMSLVTLFVVQLMAMICVHRATIAMHNHPLLITAAYDLLARDIRAAQETFDAWDTSGTSWRWKIADGFVSWRLEETKLVRCQERTIDGVLEQRQALIVDGIASCVLQPRTPRLIQVTLQPCTATSPDILLNRCVTICNGYCS